MDNLSKIILDTLEGGLAPIELVIQQEIEKQRDPYESDNRVTIPAPPNYSEELF